jgi:hypothetical protein
VNALLLYFGYLLCSVFDQMEIDAVLDEEAEWEEDPSDPDHEIWRGLARLRLPKEHQTTVYRVGEFLKRMR